jgi:hypothetical protein
LAIRIRLNIFLTAAFGRGPEPQTGTQGTGVTIPSYSKTKQRQWLICRKSACQGRYSRAVQSGFAATGRAQSSVSVSSSRRRQMAAFHAHRQTGFALHDGGESRQIWQHGIPAVEAAPILDHLPDDQIEDAGLGGFAGRIIVGPASGWPM